MQTSLTHRNSHALTSSAELTCVGHHAWQKTAVSVLYACAHMDVCLYGKLHTCKCACLCVEARRQSWLVPQEHVLTSLELSDSALLAGQRTLYLPYWDYNMLHYALLTLEALNSGFILMWQALTSVSSLSSPHVDCLMICDGKHYEGEKGMFFCLFFLWLN